MKRILLAILAAALPICATAQVSFDKMVHDFGGVTVSDGPLTCSFTVQNKGSKPVTVAYVLSSCGCTDVKWSREAIAPGKTGTITATYSNDEGPYPFDKTLSVYIPETGKKPHILHIKGVVSEKKKSLAETYPVHYGPLALSDAQIKAGNLTQGGIKSGEFTVANTGGSSVKLSFADVSDGMTLNVDKNIIAPGGTTRVTFTIIADGRSWGKKWYYATPLADGRQYRRSGSPGKPDTVPGAEALRSDPNPRIAEGKPEIGLWAVTLYDFAGVSPEQRRSGAMVSFDESTFTFSRMKAGKTVTAKFKCTNTGKEPLKILAIDSESSKVKIVSGSGATVEPGASTTITAAVSTAGLPKGEQLFLLTLYSNSPMRPVCNLFITGFIQ